MVHDPKNGAKIDQNAGFFMKNISLMWDLCLFTASYLHPNMSQSPRGNHLEEWTSREDSRVGYDHQKVAKIEQKRVFKRISITTAAKSLLTSSGWHVIMLGTPGVAYLQCWAKWEVSFALLGPKIGPKLTVLQGFLAFGPIASKFPHMKSQMCLRV